MPRWTSLCEATPPIDIAIQHHLAAVGRVKAGDHVDRGGLAGAVGTDQSQDFAGRDMEAQAVERVEAAEAL